MAAALSGEGSDAGEGSRAGDTADSSAAADTAESSAAADTAESSAAADTVESSAAADWRWRDIKNERRDPLNLDSCPFCPVFERTA